MATIREYFDADFIHAVRMHVSLPTADTSVEMALFYDFATYTVFQACYIPGEQHTLAQFIQLLDALNLGKTQLKFEGRINLPPARVFPGALIVNNANTFVLRAKFHGDPEWISFQDLPNSTRLFIYSESPLKDEQINELKEKGRSVGLRVQYRSTDHASERSRHEQPLAFISHDSNDKAVVARKIAISLQRMLCPVWYDEFSLVVGANLRDSIEDGLKKCKKCILVLSQSFFANGGWTKRELDSIFTREILEQRQLVLPVWYGVTKEAVYNYCPSLLNVKGLDWKKLGEEEVCRQLGAALLNQ
jgi:hypothetical protein